MYRLKNVFLLLALVFTFTHSLAKPRARELGIPFDGTPGKANALTDVSGVELGYTTLIQGEGKLQIGKGPVRTGVTAIHPRGKNSLDPVFAAWYTLNGNGEMTGTTWVEESGFLEGPIVLTNTASVGVVRDAVVQWRVQQGKPEKAVGLPVVGETWDGYLNDEYGQHIRPEHVYNALDTATHSSFQEGAVGSGTGMICFEFKCGIGTSSRMVEFDKKKYTVATLVQANFGLRHHLKIAGKPIGKILREGTVYSQEKGSILVVIATDAPLLPHQLKRIAKRTSLGLGRVGSVAADSSGDIFIAFSTNNPNAKNDNKVTRVETYPNDKMTELFEATVQSVEESVINALVAGETMTGVDNHKVLGIPKDKLKEIFSVK